MTQGYRWVDLTGEFYQGLQRAGLTMTISVMTPHGEAEASLSFIFTLPEAVPWIIVDVTIDYPYTTKEDVLHNSTQKLRRYLDLRWIEVAPFNIHPALDADRDDPIRVWKHNYLDVTSYYDLNYGQINDKNSSVDSFNHQVTAGWVAVSDKSKGLLLGQSVEGLTSYAFWPMRLKEDGEKKQSLWLNPFGSYLGDQLDYAHREVQGLVLSSPTSFLPPCGLMDQALMVNVRLSPCLWPHTQVTGRRPGWKWRLRDSFIRLWCSMFRHRMI